MPTHQTHYVVYVDTLADTEMADNFTEQVGEGFLCSHGQGHTLSDFWLSKAIPMSVVNDPGQAVVFPTKQAAEDHFKQVAAAVFSRIGLEGRVLQVVIYDRMT